MTERVRSPNPARRATARRRVGRALVGVLAATTIAASVANASDGDGGKYNPREAGHPLRIVAYVLHPIGVVIDRLILRPAYWIGSHEPIKTLVGRED